MSDGGVSDSLPAGESESADATRQIISPGARLAAYRQERGWTVEQVASQLNLAPRQIAAIESDDYPALPGMAIVRGFIRAYAKLLKVDPAPMLAALGGDTLLAVDSIAPRKALATPFAEARLPTMTERSSLSAKWPFAVLLLLLIGVAVWATRQSGEFSGLSGSASSSVKEGLAFLSRSESAEQKAASPAPRPVASVPTAATGGNAVVEPLQNAEVAPVAPTEPATSEADAKSFEKNTVPTGRNSLLLEINSDSWIEVRRADNNSVVLSRIAKAGTTESIDVNEPLSIVIGNAAGVDATFRGEPLALKSGANNNVARLSLK